MFIFVIPAVYVLIKHVRSFSLLWNFYSLRCVNISLQSSFDCLRISKSHKTECSFSSRNCWTNTLHINIYWGGGGDIIDDDNLLILLFKINYINTDSRVIFDISQGIRIL